MRNKTPWTIPVLALIVLLAASLATAGLREAQPVKTPVNHLSKGDCKQSPTYPVPDNIIITVSGNDVTVLHADAYYNCCLNISTQVQQEGYAINLYEDEWGDNPCYCLCYYDLETTIYDLEPGTYTISVYNDQGQYVGGGLAIIHEGQDNSTPTVK